MNWRLLPPHVCDRCSTFSALTCVPDLHRYQTPPLAVGASAAELAGPCAMRTLSIDAARMRVDSGSVGAGAVKGDRRHALLAARAGAATAGAVTTLGSVGALRSAAQPAAAAAAPRDHATAGLRHSRAAGSESLQRIVGLRGGAALRLHLGPRRRSTMLAALSVLAACLAPAGAERHVSVGRTHVCTIRAPDQAIECLGIGFRGGSPVVNSTAREFVGFCCGRQLHVRPLHRQPQRRVLGPRGRTGRLAPGAAARRARRTGD